MDDQKTQSFPLKDYDSLYTEEIVEKLNELNAEEVEKLCRYETANENRRTLLRYFENRIIALAATSSDASREDPPPGEERPEKRKRSMRTIGREDPPPGEERPERRVR